MSLFFLIATIYSSAGLAGGSSYLALMFLFDFPPEHAVVLALVLNTTVSFIGTNIFTFNRQLDFGALKWLLLGSIPAAFFGGQLIIPKDILKLILGGALLFSGIWILATSYLNTSKTFHVQKNPLNQGLVGACIGFISGVVGIGGGIFLAPILILFNWENGKKISALTSAFILCNSVSGLIGKWSSNTDFSVVLDYKYLILSVIVGGIIGSYLTVLKLSPIFLKRNTGLIILFAGVRLLFKF